MILYIIYNIILHVTFIFFTLTVLFRTIISSKIQSTFDEKSKHIAPLLDHDVIIKDKLAHNERWWLQIFIINGVLVSISFILSGVLSLYNKKQVLKILATNVTSTSIVVFIQLIIIEFLIKEKYSSIGPSRFELIILKELKNKL